MVKISIIIPVYNAERYLDRCINSVLNQNFTEWELILLNDGSKDLSGEICNKYKKIDSRIKVIHKENTGVSATRNLGIDVSKGNYITFIDSDDWIEKDYLNEMYSKIKKMNVSLLITGYVKEKNGVVMNPFIQGNEKIYEKKDIQLEFLKQEKFMWSVYDKLFSRELIGNQRFITRLKIAEDMYFFWNILKKTYKVGYVPLYKYHYDISASNTMTAPFSLKWIDCIRVRKKIYEDCKTISKKHRVLSKMIYIGELGVLAKKAINCSSQRYSTKLLVNYLQKKIRKNIVCCFFYPNSRAITFRQRLGIIYFSLPYRLCILGKIFLKCFK